MRVVRFVIYLRSTRVLLEYIFMGAGYVGRMGREVEQFRTMGDCAPSWGRSGRELDTRVGRTQKLPPD